MKDVDEIVGNTPIFVIRKVSNKGLVDIDFSEKFFEVNNLTLIDQSVLQLEIEKGEESTDESK